MVKIYVIKDEENNILDWFTSKEPAEEMLKNNPKYSITTLGY